MNLNTNIQSLLSNARKSSRQIASADETTRNKILQAIADELINNCNEILVQNKIDLDFLSDQDPKKDRLILNEDRIDGLVQSIKEIKAAPKPDGQVVYTQTLDNGLVITKSLVPMGVVAAIYESRPNVTIDLATLCIKSGNAAILRGGTDAYNTNKILVSIIRSSISEVGLSEDIITLFPPDRAHLQDLLTADRFVDLVIPRGSSNLIDYVRANSKIPTIETGAGVCHTYVSANADIQKAVPICINAKVTRPAVCNALDCIIVHKAVANIFLPQVADGLKHYHTEIFADEQAYGIISNYPYLQYAEESDFGREFLDYKCSIKVVENTEEALQHIEKYSSRHSECIVSESKEECEYFINQVDAASIYSNASTRFTDGGVFGLGAEIGISTQKLHARGPFGMEKLVTEKWIGRGNGQVRI